MNKLLRETKGAVYVEFLGVFMPLFIFFLAIVQLIFVQTANLVTNHAAMTAVRAACVVIPDDPANNGGVPPGSVSGKKKQDIEKAAAMPLSALGPEGEGVTVKLNGSYAIDEIIKVRVEYDYKCRVPGGALLVCGADGVKTLVAEAELPNQGASYKYGP